MNKLVGCESWVSLSVVSLIQQSIGFSFYNNRNDSIKAQLINCLVYMAANDIGAQKHV
jgi:hypothetical protein